MPSTAASSMVRSNRELRRFVVLLAGTFLLFLGAFHFWIAQSIWFTRYLELNARLSAVVLRAFGTDARAEGVQLRGDESGLEIKHGCDALQPTAFFVIAMLSSPVAIPLRRRILPIALGVAALLMLNIARIVSLFYVQKYKPSWFEMFHMDIWQAVFIFVPLVLWIAWAVHATPLPERTAHVPA